MALHFVFPGFSKLELEHAQTNLNRVEAAFDADLRQINLQAFDWATWDDTYRFIKNKNSDYISSNLTFSAFKNSNLDFILFLDLNLELVWGKAYELDQGVENDAHEVLLDLNPVIKPLLGEGVSLSGIASVRGSEALLAIRPIIDSKESLPIRGYLVFGRYIDTALISEFSEQTSLKFNVHSLRNGGISIVQEDAYKDADIPFISKTLTDLSNVPALKVELKVDESISRSGKVSIFYMVISVAIVCFLVLLIQLAFLNRVVLKPIELLVKHMKDHDAQQQEKVEIDERRNDEVGVLASCYLQLLTNLKATQGKLEELVHTDELTSLPNRRFFWQTVKTEWSRHIRERQPIAILVLDIDFFKMYNDRYGHLEGDKCLQITSNIMKHSLKRSTDLIARIGGEEFAVALPNTDAESALLVAKHIVAEVNAAQIPHAGSQVSEFVSVSVGISACVPQSSDSIQDLIDLADKALYQAKQSGRNRALIYEAHLKNKPIERTS